MNGTLNNELYHYGIKGMKWHQHVAVDPAAQARLDAVNSGKDTKDTIVGGNSMEYITASGGSVSKIFLKENGKVSVSYLYQDAKTTKARKSGENFISKLAWHFDNGSE